MSELGVPYHWRRFPERYRLIGMKCLNCNNVFFPVRAVCPNCRRRGKIERVQFSGKGTVYSYTVIRVPPEGFEEYAPYILAIVELEEGPRVMTQLVDCSPEEVRIGMPVEVCFRRIMSKEPSGIVCYGFKFRPAKPYDLKMQNSLQPS